MKKLLIVALAGIRVTLFAQTYTSPNKFIGKMEIVFSPTLIIPRVNNFPEYINKASFGKITVNYKNKFGYSTGVGLIHSFGDRIDLNTRFLFEMKGYESETTNTSTLDTTYRINSNTKSSYFAISVLPTYFIGKLKRTQLFAGASYSHLINSYNHFSWYKNSQVYYQGRNPSGDVRPFEIALIIGVGHNVAVGNSNKIGFQVSWAMGINDIVNSLDSNPNPNNLAIKNNYLLFTIIFQHDKARKPLKQGLLTPIEPS